MDHCTNEVRSEYWKGVIQACGQRALKDFPQEEIPHDVSREKLVITFGEGNWKSMPEEIFWQLRFEPAKWIAEKHVIKVYNVNI